MYGDICLQTRRLQTDVFVGSAFLDYLTLHITIGDTTTFVVCVLDEGVIQKIIDEKQPYNNRVDVHKTITSIDKLVARAIGCRGCAVECPAEIGVLRFYVVEDKTQPGIWIGTNACLGYTAVFPKTLTE